MKDLDCTPNLSPDASPRYPSQNQRLWRHWDQQSPTKEGLHTGRTQSLVLSPPLSQLGSDKILLWYAECRETRSLETWSTAKRGFGAGIMTYCGRQLSLRGIPKDRCLRS